MRQLQFSAFVSTRFLILLGLAVSLLGCDNPMKAASSQAYINNEIIVHLKPGAAHNLHSKIQLNASHFNNEEPQRLQKASAIAGKNIELWKANGLNVEEAIKELSQRPEIAYVEPNYKIHLAATQPDDPKYSSQYSLVKSGLGGISAPDAWSVHTGTDVIVAVIDTGIQLDHPDLKDNLWVNEGEIPDNGIDDDKNGFIDDVHGYDFSNNDGDPTDDHSHGSHVAGVIGASGNNGIGVTGVNWSAKLMALKVFNSSGSGGSYGATKAMHYALDHGAQISNHSWVTTGQSTTLKEVIDRAKSMNHLVVAAAGNSGRDIDETPYYPAGFEHTNIIAVAATNDKDLKPSWSNYGLKSVDLSAPGVGIYNTFNSSNYGNKSGTSMAAPHVAGAAALLWSYKPGLSVNDLKSTILNNVDPVSVLDGMVATGGRLNLGKAIISLSDDPTPPTLTLASDSAETKFETNLTLDVLANDSDSSLLNITRVGSAKNGELTINENGDFDGTDTLTYTPNTGFSGTDTFTYSAERGDGATGTASVTVTVHPADTTPPEDPEDPTPPDDGGSLPPVVAEFGEVEGVGTEPHVVQLQNSYKNPVVFAQGPSQENGSLTMSRISDIQATQFTIQLETTTQSATEVTPESITYFVIESGRWTLQSGLLIEAGTTKLEQASAEVTYTAAFTEKPSVFTMLQAQNQEGLLQARVKASTAAGFSIVLQNEGQLLSATAADETLGWVALEPGSGTWSGHRFLVGSTGEDVRGDTYSIGFPDFSSPPRVLASIAAVTNETATHLQRSDLSTSQVNFKLQKAVEMTCPAPQKPQELQFLLLEGSGQLRAQ